MAAIREPAHLLIVDDDRRIRELLRSYLSENGFRVSVAGSAKEARQAMQGLNFDLLVLDIMMPGESGLELVEFLRGAGRAQPVLMLSALAEPEDRIRGLLAGGDDYLPKPFEPQELLLRIRSILRRALQPDEPPSEVRFGAFVFHLGRGELRRDGEIVRLTASERDLLRLLAQRGGAPASRGELSEPGAGEDARSVDVRINRLRQKIEDDPANPVYLRTLRGAGYALAADGGG
jgi:two-component system, OmpR family, phosphate regulon response regulator OmpR